MKTISRRYHAGYQTSNNIFCAARNDVNKKSFLSVHLKMNFIGEFAALATSFFFAVTVIIFTIAGRMVGPQVTNRMRLLFALVYLSMLIIILFQEPLPFSTESSRWL